MVLVFPYLGGEILHSKVRGTGFAKETCTGILWNDSWKHSHGGLAHAGSTNCRCGVIRIKVGLARQELLITNY